MRPGLIVALVALAWLPLVLLAAFDSRPGVDPLLLHAEPHARLLVALVVLLLAEPALDKRIGMSVHGVLNDGSLRALERKRWSEALHRVQGWRDAKLFELLWLAATYGALLLAYFDRLPDWLLRWMLSSLHVAQWSEGSPAWWWYVLVSQPLLMLMLGRWLYRWALWMTLLVRLARARPDVQVSHGDEVGGLALLRLPIAVLPGFALALGSAIAAVWFDEIAAGRAQLSTFGVDLLVFLLACVALVLLPYLPLTPMLVRARERGLLSWSALAHRHAAEFEQRWIERAQQERADLLEHPDASTLADLRTLTHGVERMRVLVPTREDLRSVLLAAALPFLLAALAQGSSAANLIRSAVLRFLGV